jgi:DUF1009 family protein
MLKREAERRSRRRGGLLVKWPKPGQELRVDMPAIGPNTVDAVAAAGLDGIVVQAGATLAAQRKEMLDAANRKSIFIAGVESSSDFSNKTELQDDGAIGLAVLSQLLPLVRSRGAVAVRRHVLAVETGEGLEALVARAAGLRQWGNARKRRGALSVSSAADLDASVIAAAAKAGYECIAVAGEAPPSGDVVHAIRAAGLRLDDRCVRG